MILTRGLGGVAVVTSGLGDVFSRIAASVGSPYDLTTAEAFGPFTAATFDKATAYVYQGERRPVVLAEGSALVLFDLATRALVTDDGTTASTDDTTTATLGAKSAAIITTGGNP